MIVHTGYRVTWADGSEADWPWLREQLESTRRHLEDLWAAIDHAESGCGLTRDDFHPAGEGLCEDGGSREQHAETGDPREELAELPLEIVWEKGEPFAVVLGTGGPHIEIRGGTRHDGSGYALHGYWASEHVVIRGESISRTGEYFRELVEETDQ